MRPSAEHLRLRRSRLAPSWCSVVLLKSFFVICSSFADQAPDGKAAAVSAHHGNMSTTERMSAAFSGNWIRWQFDMMAELVSTTAALNRRGMIAHEGLDFQGRTLDIPLFIISRPGATAKVGSAAQNLRAIGFENIEVGHPISVHDLNDSLVRDFARRGLLDMDAYSRSQKESGSKVFSVHLTVSLAHVLTIRRAVEEGLSMFGVVEDDITLGSSPSETRMHIEKGLEQLPASADMLYLEACHEDCTKISALEDGKPNLVRAVRPMCSAGIIFTRKGAERILDLVLPLRDVIDTSYKIAIEKGDVEAYLLSPLALHQDAIWESSCDNDVIPIPPGVELLARHRLAKPLCSNIDGSFEVNVFELFFVGYIADAEQMFTLTATGRGNTYVREVSMPACGLHYAKWNDLLQGETVVYYTKNRDSTSQGDTYSIEVGVWRPGGDINDVFVVKIPEDSACFAPEEDGFVCQMEMVLESAEYEMKDSLIRMLFLRNSIDGEGSDPGNDPPQDRGATVESDDEEETVEVRALNLWRRLFEGDGTNLNEENKFLLVAFGNTAFFPFFASFVCNTAHMPHVHERILLVFSDVEAYKEMLLWRQRHHHQFHVAIQVMQGPMSKEYEFGTVGYCLLMEQRNKIVGRLLGVGVSVLLFEPDAVWTTNPLEDGLLSDPRAEVVVFRNVPEKHQGHHERDEIGMGFTLLRATEGVRKHVWGPLMSKHRRELSYLDKELISVTTENASRLASLYADKIRFGYRDEMALFQDLIHDVLETSVVRVIMLPWCLFPSGLWYDGGIGGDGYALRRACSERYGPPVVIQNNFIVGLRAKRSRAKRWGHWFLQERQEVEEASPRRELGLGCEDGERFASNLASMNRSLQTLVPFRCAGLDECPGCEFHIYPSLPRQASLTGLPLRRCMEMSDIQWPLTVRTVVDAIAFQDKVDNDLLLHEQDFTKLQVVHPPLASSTDCLSSGTHVSNLRTCLCLDSLVCPIDVIVNVHGLFNYIVRGESYFAIGVLLDDSLVQLHDVSGSDDLCSLDHNYCNKSTNQNLHSVVPVRGPRVHLRLGTHLSSAYFSEHSDTPSVLSAKVVLVDAVGFQKLESGHTHLNLSYMLKDSLVLDQQNLTISLLRNQKRAVGGVFESSLCHTNAQAIAREDWISHVQSPADVELSSNSTYLPVCRAVWVTVHGREKQDSELFLSRLEGAGKGADSHLGDADGGSKAQYFRFGMLLSYSVVVQEPFNNQKFNLGQEWYLLYRVSTPNPADDAIGCSGRVFLNRILLSSGPCNPLHGGFDSMSMHHHVTLAGWHEVCIALFTGRDGSEPTYLIGRTCIIVQVVSS